MILRALLLLILAACCSAQSLPIFTEIDAMMADLSFITGWQVKRKVPSETLSRTEFARQLEESVKDSENDKDVRATELTLKMFGLTPWNYNLARESADLMSEQAAAFYDIRKHRLFVVESARVATASEQRVALVHELAHALADQQFGLNKFLEGAKEDDASMARQAVIEGQASWLSWAYLNFKATGRADVPASILNQLSDTQASAEFPVLAEAPLYVQESLLFPYSEGMRFQDEIHKQSGRDGFGRLFRDPPVSSQQVMHPDSYVRAVMPTHPKPLSLASVLGKEAGQFKSLLHGDVGEFDFSTLLREYVGNGPGRTAAAAWRGGAFRLFGHKKDKYPLLLHVSEWESPEAAARFFELYEQVLRAKWTKLEISAKSATELRGTGDTGQFLLRLDGVHVHVIEGIHGSPQTRGLVR